ncbi:hypothetical protein DNH61_00500 [Paenibacillus sambharensis]|uniref:Uncharacterized protein n=1 Tax=Paenibacillus sambharensis TaxID=1803190 RepID=A0A2W1LFG3_9BACL|nr:hypothetical protein [Paenibacillus sambharensis]PZD97776.1 hypothetical protein DNH61_00500 [Paenibacillus sambharensis]
MEPFWIAIGVIAVVSAVGAAAFRRNRVQHPGGRRRGGTKPPPVLGVREDHPAYSAALRLEAVLDDDFIARVKDRVLHAEPNLAEQQWEWRWFELKRYFLMCGIMRAVPMYSSKVDDIWHEMLMFTREYQVFCERFCGAMIHHAPHGKAGQPRPDERAMFEWVYTELFGPPAQRPDIWGPFYRVPMSPGLLSELANKSECALKERRFNMRAAERFGDLEASVDRLIKTARGQISEAKSRIEQGEDRLRRESWPQPVEMMGAAMIFASMSQPQQYDRHMEQLTGKAERGQGSGSSCNSSYYGGDSRDAGDCTPSGGDGGGSSCSSSCGGGCSS